MSSGLNFILPVGHFTETSLMTALECASTPCKGSPDPVPVIYRRLYR